MGPGEEPAEPWTTAEVRRRHGELGPVRRGRCGFRRPNNTVCARTKALAQNPSLTSMLARGLQWELGHCKDHLTDAERDFAGMVERVSEFEDAVLLTTGRGLLEEMKRLEAHERDRQNPERPPLPGLPACWAWMREDVESQAAGSVLMPRAATLRDLWKWQEERCALCGRYGVTDLDHDHWSGLIRGFLCRSCNGSGSEEGQGGVYWPVGTGPWARYRQLNPARWLRLRLSYEAAQYQQRQGLAAPDEG